LLHLRAQSRVAWCAGKNDLAARFLQQTLLDLNRRRGGATKKCNLSRGGSRGILDADDYSLTTRASS
jgi:hypothetical protein